MIANRGVAVFRLNVRFVALPALWCAVWWATWWVCCNRHDEMRPTKLMEKDKN
jgi:hypothetical protein